jgi:hypothetical protein
MKYTLDKGTLEKRPGNAPLCILIIEGNPRRPVVKYVVRTLGFLLLGAVLAGCSFGFETPELEAQAFSLGGLRQVTLNKPFNPPAPNDPGKYNCVTTEFDVPPQGMRLQGSTGGLGYTPLASNTTAGAVGAGLRGNFFSTFSSTPQNTEILIVDDFGKFDSPSYTLPSDLFTNSSSQNIQNLINDGSLRHGALVMRHANDAVKGFGLYQVSSQSANSSQTTYNRSGSSLMVTAVNTRLASQAVIAGTTRRKVTTGDLYSILYSTLKNAKTTLVINMSFVLTPCEVYEDFVLSGKPTLEVYIEALASVNNLATNSNGVIDATGTSSAGERNLVDRIIESINITSDPLKKLIDLFAATHIFVAASGNYGLPTAMYPAKWTGVVNVTGSAIDNQNVRTTNFFNAGEVMSAGLLFKLNPPTASGKPIYYFGTSYAAPSVSVYSALDLAGKQRCTDSQTFKSELALDTPSLIDRRLETVGTTNGAVQTRCGTN